MTSTGNPSRGTRQPYRWCFLPPGVHRRLAQGLDSILLPVVTVLTTVPSGSRRVQRVSRTSRRSKSPANRALLGSIGTKVWYSSRTQNSVPFGECGFESHLRHTRRNPAFAEVFLTSGGVRRIFALTPGDTFGDSGTNSGLKRTECSVRTASPCMPVGNRRPRSHRSGPKTDAKLRRILGCPNLQEAFSE